MSRSFNKEVEKIAVSDIRQFDSDVSGIPGIIKLTLGEPDFNTPEHVKKAAIKAIEDNKSHYTPNAGFMELREETAKYFNKKYNLNYSGTQVVTTVGATEAINASLQAILNPDDETVEKFKKMYSDYQNEKALLKEYAGKPSQTKDGVKV